MVTVDLLESVDEPSLRAAGFQLGDTLITGSDRREWVKTKELRNRERNTVISSILLLARSESVLYLVLLEASRKSKDPNALIEAAENLFNSPCMATCLSIVADEQRKYASVRENKKLASLPVSRNYHQITWESTIQFLNVFTDEQKATPQDMPKILELKSFCLDIDNLETIVKEDQHALRFISQYVRGHKGPPLGYDQDGFWRDFDVHLSVFHENNRQKKLLSASQAAESSSIQQNDAELLRHIKVLKRDRLGSAKYRAAIKALRLSLFLQPQVR